MKRYWLLLVIILGVTVAPKAQTKIKIPIEQLGVNENTVVTDSSGLKYSYTTWSRLMKSGDYKLTPVHYDSDSTAFILTKRKEQIEDKLFSNSPRPEEAKFFKVGEAFKFVNLKDINGVVLDANDLMGKIVVINFWFIACPPCRYEMPELNRVVRRYQNNSGVIFIAISLDRKEDIQKFLKVSPFEYHVIGDSWSLFRYYKVTQCPVSLVVDKKGIIRFNSIGSGNGSVPYWIKKTISELN